jgi:ribonuclease HII
VRVGLDEAGLGPTLGPLVVAGFATRREADAGDEVGPVDDLLGPLAALVGPPGVRDGRLEVGDSKKIHAGARKLERIERTALATVAWMNGGQVPASVAELLELVAVGDFEHEADRRAPWWSMLDEALPIVGERAAIEAAARRLAECAAGAGVEPLWYRADVVGAARVNRELAAEHAREGTKNTWATHVVLRLAKLAIDELDAPLCAVWCDKAGGRNAYIEPLRRVFPELPAEPEEPSLFAPGAGLERVLERRESSHYRLHFDRRRIELGFVMGGDRLDPRISWASILAKYLRELVLRAFNRYFAARLPQLRATAGYPQDAKRFIAEVEAGLGRELGFGREAWIRCK